MPKFHDEHASGGVKEAVENAKFITSRKLSKGDLMLMENINGMNIDRRVSDLDSLTRDKSQQSSQQSMSQSSTSRTERTVVDSKIDEVFIIPFKF